MHMLIKVHSTNDYNLVQCLHLQLTAEYARWLRACLELIRPVAAHAAFAHTAFHDSTPTLLFKLQDELRPLMSQLERDATQHVQLPQTAVFGPNTELEPAASGLVCLAAAGCSWRLKPRTASYEVLSGVVPWEPLLALE